MFAPRKGRSAVAAVAMCFAAHVAAAQAPVASALKDALTTATKNFTGSLDRMPESKLAYKPTPANMTYAEHMVHIADFSELMCGLIGGTKAPAHSKVDANAGKAAIEAHLKRAFAFCNDALATLDDSRLADTVPFFGSSITRAKAILIIAGDWADHYAVTSTYLRLNGVLPPTAR